MPNWSLSKLPLDQNQELVCLSRPHQSTIFIAIFPLTSEVRQFEGDPSDFPRMQFRVDFREEATFRVVTSVVTCPNIRSRRRSGRFLSFVPRLLPFKSTDGKSQPFGGDVDDNRKPQLHCDTAIVWELSQTHFRGHYHSMPTRSINAYAE